MTASLRQLVLIGWFTFAAPVWAQTPAPAAPAAPAAPTPNPAATDKVKHTTVENLQTRLLLTRGDAATYKRFAAKADEESLPALASLFRAVERSTNLHADVLARAIEKSGAKPDAAAPKTADVKTSRENLQAALKAIAPERDVTLPAAGTQAKTEGHKDAATAFKYVRESLVEHARFFKDALDAPDTWKKPRRDYFVSRTCGFTVDKLDIKKCPVCFAERDNFERVN